mmetsp:Transcript_12077/g.36829  ORF Transcript_12077/g.36829 Transcript_12077/m.36829 type:complete len:650 (-) Transcript_12077:702-2651(-)
MGSVLNIEHDAMYKKARQELDNFRLRIEEERIARERKLEEEAERKRAYEREREAERLRSLKAQEERKRQLIADAERGKKLRAEALARKLAGQDASGKDESGRFQQQSASETYPAVLPALRLAMLPSSIKAVDVRSHFWKLGCVKVTSLGPFWIVVFKSRDQRDRASDLVQNGEHQDRHIRKCRFEAFALDYTVPRDEENELLGRTLRLPKTRDELCDDVFAQIRSKVRDSILREVRGLLDSAAASRAQKSFLKKPENKSSVTDVLKSLPKLVIADPFAAERQQRRKVFDGPVQVGDAETSKPQIRPSSGAKADVRKRRKLQRSDESEIEVPEERTDALAESRRLSRPRAAKARKMATMDDNSSSDFEILSRSESEAENDLKTKAQAIETKDLFSETSALDLIPDESGISLDDRVVPASSDEAEDEAHDETELDIINPTGCARSEPFQKLDPRRKNKFVEADVPVDVVKTAPKNLREEERGIVRRQRRGIEIGNESVNLTRHSLKAQKKAVRFGKSRIHGYGLYAIEAIEEKEYVTEYIGEVIRNSIADVRESRYQRQGMGDSYMFRVSSDAVVDATLHGAPARYVNHSCEPNVDAMIVDVEQQKKIVFYSKRSIAQGEEITYDYKFEFEEDEAKIPCLCGAKTCRKFLN